MFIHVYFYINYSDSQTLKMVRTIKSTINPKQGLRMLSRLDTYWASGVAVSEMAIDYANLIPSRLMIQHIGTPERTYP